MTTNMLRKTTEVSNLNIFDLFGIDAEPSKPQSPSNDDNKRLRSIDLFAGIGGIRLGFDQAFSENIETVFISEWDVHAQNTYKANFGDEIEISGDITKIDENRIPSFDICLAGFPCQAFSLAGQRKGFQGHLYKHYFLSINLFQFRLFLLSAFLLHSTSATWNILPSESISPDRKSVV